MVSIITLLKKVLQRLKLIDDFVVETGTDGIWTYRKWDSGTAECWTTETISDTFTYSSAVFDAYAYYKWYNLPDGLFESMSFSSATGRTGTGIGFGFITFSGVTSLRLFIVGNQNSSSVTSARMYISGRWK